MAEIQKQLLAVVTELRLDLIKSFALNNRVASGRTENQLIATATDEQAQLTAPFWIYALQDGRKPTRANAPTGDPTLQQEIALWCNDKGIDPKLSFVIARHIHKYGYPGTPGIIDKPLSDDNIDRVLNNQLGELAALFQQQIANSIQIPQSQTLETVS